MVVMVVAAVVSTTVMSDGSLLGVCLFGGVLRLVATWLWGMIGKWAKTG